MKKRWIFWWIVNLIWLILFAAGSLVIWIRDIDGAGVTQTWELRLLAFGVLLIAFLFPLVIQIIWLIINFVVGDNHDAKEKVGEDKRGK